MARYDQGGGCACGQERVCDCVPKKQKDEFRVSIGPIMMNDTIIVEDDIKTVLREVLEVLRSTYAIAQRESKTPKTTNWEPFTKRVKTALTRVNDALTNLTKDDYVA